LSFPFLSHAELQKKHISIFEPHVYMITDKTIPYAPISCLRKSRTLKETAVRPIGTIENSSFFLGKQ
jgi:hypothetical protein